MKRTKRIRALLMVIVLGMLLSAHVTVAMEAGDFEASLARAVKEDKPLIIDFYTDW